MRKTVSWVLVWVFTTAAAVPLGERPRLPQQPPRQNEEREPFDRRVRLEVEYDDAFAALHGAEVEERIREAVAIHNLAWRRFRREWFELARLTFRPSPRQRDASYVLASFLQRTTGKPDTIHVVITGRPLEVYSSGTRATPIGGFAYRGSDALAISATPGVTTGMLAYYLFHEIGHCWEALDIPFHGGDTTYGSKSAFTFVVDAGNEQIMEDSPGPAPRGTPRRAPAVIRQRLAEARRVARDLPMYPRVHDLMLHEPSPANPAYLAKKRAVLAAAGPHRAKVARLLATFEPTRQHLRDDAEVRRQIAEHYWRANDALRSEQLECAQAELNAIRAIATPSDVHMLVGAVQKRVRRRR